MSGPLFIHLLTQSISLFSEIRGNVSLLGILGTPGKLFNTEVSSAMITGYAFSYCYAWG